MNDYILEVCVDSAESALAAAKGGASRLELCQNLVIGGTTPGSKLFEVIRRQTTIPIHALIRPRFGDFCYTPYELEEIREEVAMYRELGAEGVVVGVLKEDGTMNMAAMEQLMEAADGMSVTLHRAFDVCRDPKEALEQAVLLGMNTILTSGQQNSAVKGAELLAELQRQAAGRIRIQAGGGICADAIRELAKQPCIIIGRCASEFLKDKSNVINIYVCADKEDRIKRIMKLFSLTREAAEVMLEETDKQRAEYYYKNTGKTWGDVNNYHMILNTSDLGIENCADILMRYFEMKDYI